LAVGGRRADLVRVRFGMCEFGLLETVTRVRRAVGLRRTAGGEFAPVGGRRLAGGGFAAVGGWRAVGLSDQKNRSAAGAEPNRTGGGETVEARLWWFLG
jgi:hypothetical protein